jgi:hypothetical protein
MLYFRLARGRRAWGRRGRGNADHVVKNAVYAEKIVISLYK